MTHPPDKWITVEGDKPKVEAARKYFAEFRASLQNARDVERDLRAEFERLQDEKQRLREALREVHEFHCGCDRPGNPSACVAKPVEEFACLSDSYWCKRPPGRRGRPSVTSSALSQSWVTSCANPEDT